MPTSVRVLYVDESRDSREVLSAALETDKKKGIEAGANAYVAKPDVDELVGSIERFVFKPRNIGARIIPFRQRTNVSQSFNPGPAAA